MHIVISRYAGAADKVEEALPKVHEEFVPFLKGCHGFLGYVALPTEQGDVVAFHIWETADAVANSRDKIRSWVQATLKGFEEPTERFPGEVLLHSVVAPQSGGPDQSLYCLVRQAEGIVTGGSQRQNLEEMLAAAKSVPGFRGMYCAPFDDDPTRGVVILLCDTREQAFAVHEATIAISRRNQPNMTFRVAASGQTAILAMG
jgi:heme-degrading monooxygenase HmoA